MEESGSKLTPEQAAGLTTTVALLENDIEVIMIGVSLFRKRAEFVGVELGARFASIEHDVVHIAGQFKALRQGWGV